MSSGPRVLISARSIDDATVLAGAFERSAELAVVAVVPLADSHASCLSQRPDAVLVVGDTGSHDALTAIRQVAPIARVLLVDPGDQATLAEGLLAGAHGVLRPDATAADVARMIRAVERDGVVCPDGVAFDLFARLAHLRAKRVWEQCLVSTDLSFQEITILRLLGAGLSNKEIARQANLSVYTVKNHVHRILKQLGLRDRTHAAAYLQGVIVE